MKPNTRMMVLAGLLLGIGSTAYAQTAGRVLVAVGDTTALRNGIAMPLANGSEVLAGDTLRTGSNSNLQVRFTDEGVMALRADSAYKIESYQFANKVGEDKSVVSLLKGGLRAITGIIGRSSRENYAVSTPTSTIGIRGTHFVLAQCANDCFNKDGSQAENGLFGGVTDGRIVVKNQSGEREFGRSEFFHVVSQSSVPVPLLAPPSFLRDQLSGQSKAKQVTKVAAGGSSKSGESATGGESSSGTSTETANTTVSNQMTITSSVTTPITENNLIQYVPAEQPVAVAVAAAATGSTGGTINFKINMVEAASGIESRNSSTYSFTYPSSDAESYIETGTVNLDLIGSFAAEDIHRGELIDITAFLKNPLSESGTFTEYCVGSGSSTSCGPQWEKPSNAYSQTVNYSVTKDASTEVNSNLAAGNAQWGVYKEIWSDSIVSGPNNGQTSTGTEYVHWATGDMVDLALLPLPTSGIHTYTHVGGTRPTDQHGTVGTFAVGSSVAVQFQSYGADVRVINAHWSMPASGTMPATTYSLNMGSAVPVTITQSSNTFPFGSSTETKIRGTGMYGTVPATATCTGCSSGFADVNIAGTLFGATGTGLAAGITSRATLLNGTTEQTTASVQVYKR